MKKSYPLYVSWVSCGLLLGTILTVSKASDLHAFTPHIDFHARDSSTDQLEKEYNEKMEKQKKEREEKAEKEKAEKDKQHKKK